MGSEEINKGGRPSTYREEYCDKVDEYLKINQDEYKQIVVRTEEEEDVNSTVKLKVNLPTIGGFSLFLDVPERTLYDWRDSFSEFSQSLGKIVKEQEKRLLNMGLSGEYNPTIAKLILSSNHGMSDKVQHDASENLIDALHGKEIT
jgi:hypothetical protein